MSVIHAPDVTDKFTTQLVRRTAQSLVNEGTFPPSDLDDVIQDLNLALLNQVANFDPDRARWSTFVRTVVRLTAISLRRRQYAQCRRIADDVSSLNVLTKDEEGQPVEFGTTVNEEEYRSGSGQDHRSHTEQVELKLDLRVVLQKMPAITFRSYCTKPTTGLGWPSSAWKICRAWPCNSISRSLRTFSD